jgi:hemoglobin
VGEGAETPGEVGQAETLYDRVGGESFFLTLVDRFYEGVETDELLRPMYPEDLKPGKDHLASFLAQYWGGPPRYAETRGHPRLRMRHAPYAITKRARDAWLAHMSAAVDQMTMGDQDRAELLEYLDFAAHQLRNR